MKHLDVSLFWRLLLLFFTANLLVMTVGGLLVRGFIDYTASAPVERNWAALAAEAEGAYEAGGGAALAAWSERQRQHGDDATLLEHGQPLSPIRLPPRLEAQLPEWLGSGRSEVRQAGPGFSIAIQQIVGREGEKRQLLAVSHVRPRPHPELFFVTQLVLSLLVVGLISGWVARSVAKPVGALRQATRKMAGGELSARVGWTGASRDELALLANDFDRMAARIEALVAHDREVLRDLSHELRSPLARLHLLLDLSRRAATPAEAETYFAEAEQEVGRLDRMLDDTLALSRMESGLPGMESERLDLAERVAGCVETSRREAAARRVDLVMSSEGRVEVIGCATLIERAIANLLANAIKFSPIGGRVEVTLYWNTGTATVAIRDHGPGVPEAELEQLFRPFFRGSNASRADGHGLGLAIVQRVVGVHGGRVEARNVDGGGLEVRVQWPRAAPAERDAP